MFIIGPLWLIVLIFFLINYPDLVKILLVIGLILIIIVGLCIHRDNVKSIERRKELETLDTIIITSKNYETVDTECYHYPYHINCICNLSMAPHYNLGCNKSGYRTVAISWFWEEYNNNEQVAFYPNMLIAKTDEGEIIEVYRDLDMHHLYYYNLPKGTKYLYLYWEDGTCAYRISVNKNIDTFFHLE